jgi:hypothetical protein
MKNLFFKEKNILSEKILNFQGLELIQINSLDS